MLRNRLRSIFEIRLAKKGSRDSHANYVVMVIASVSEKLPYACTVLRVCQRKVKPEDISHGADNGRNTMLNKTQQHA
jgi:hypothetical protein